MCHGNFRPQKADVHLSDGERAFSKDERESIAELTLNLLTTLPPPADHINDIAVFGEQGCVGLGIVLVPRLLLSRLRDIANCSRISLSIGSRTDGDRSHYQNRNKPNSESQFFHAAY